MESESIRNQSGILTDRPFVIVKCQKKRRERETRAYKGGSPGFSPHWNNAGWVKPTPNAMGQVFGISANDGKATD